MFAADLCVKSPMIRVVLVHHLYTRSDGDQGSFAVLFFLAILEQCGGVHYHARGRSLVSGNAIPMSGFAWGEMEFRCMPK